MKGPIICSDSKCLALFVYISKTDILVVLLPHIWKYCVKTYKQIPAVKTLYIFCQRMGRMILCKWYILCNNAIKSWIPNTLFNFIGENSCNGQEYTVIFRQCIKKVVLLLCFLFQTEEVQVQRDQGVIAEIFIEINMQWIHFLLCHINIKFKGSSFKKSIKMLEILFVFNSVTPFKTM